MVALLVGVIAFPIYAQEPPPPAPARQDAGTPDNTRPPTRPAENPDTDPEEATGNPQAEPSGSLPETTPKPPDETQVFGPPAPPVWAGLRETDQEFAACRLALSLLGTVYEQIEPITDPEDRDCGIARPLMVTEILPGLTLEGGAQMRCDTARALGFWARDFLQPAAATLPDAPRLTGLRLGSTYACRGRIGTGEEQPKLSEHALGTAIDIAAFLFDDGTEPLVIEPRSDSGDQAEAFQRAARATACLFFTTVLGPGSNAAHDDHLHLDLAARRGGWRLCQ